MYLSEVSRADIGDAFANGGLHHHARIRHPWQGPSPPCVAPEYLNRGARLAHTHFFRNIVCVLVPRPPESARERSFPWRKRSQTSRSLALSSGACGACTAIPGTASTVSS